MIILCMGVLYRFSTAHNGSALGYSVRQIYFVTSSGFPNTNRRSKILHKETSSIVRDTNRVIMYCYWFSFKETFLSRRFVEKIVSFEFMHHENLVTYAWAITRRGCSKYLHFGIMSYPYTTFQISALFLQVLKKKSTEILWICYLSHFKHLWELKNGKSNICLGAENIFILILLT